MIGVVAGVGRIAMTNALRQVGRQFGREVVQRIMGGQAIENVLTREEMRLFAKIGRVAFDDLMRQGREELMNDTDKKQRDLDEKMNNFARNLNEQFRQNTRLYKEERNIANKKTTENRHGLTNAYRSPSGWYKTGKTLYLYIRNGWKRWKYQQRHFRWFIKVPTRNAHNTEKYKNVINELKKSPEITRLLSHVPQIIYNLPILICIYPFVPQPNKKLYKMKKMIKTCVLMG